MAASVRQRLLNRARAEGRDFQSLLVSYAIERFLRRLSASPYADRFILKGAQLLPIWQCPAARPTIDVDFLGYVVNDVEAVAEIVRGICQTGVEDDGISYDVDSLEGGRIVEDADYGGIRLAFRAYLGRARARMQLDIGFGDVVVPGPETVEYPTLLSGLKPPKLRVYSRESVVAEKLEAMVKLGKLNSRMKDFYDVWALAEHYSFHGPVLAEAITKTFQRRGTPIPEHPVMLSGAFARDGTKQTQWSAFLRKGRLEAPPQDFCRLMGAVAAFLTTVLEACAANMPFEQRWEPPGPWKPA